jgi:hypothetical protein
MANHGNIMRKMGKYMEILGKPHKRLIIIHLDTSIIIANLRCLAKNDKF